MRTREKTISSDQFGSYGDKLRQKLINRLNSKTECLKTPDKSVSKPNSTLSLHEKISSDTQSANQSPVESQSNMIGKSTPELPTTGMVLFLKRFVTHLLDIVLTPFHYDTQILTLGLFQKHPIAKRIRLRFYLFSHSRNLVLTILHTIQGKLRTCINYSEKVPYDFS